MTIDRVILFFGSAVLAAGGVYIVAHDIEGVCRTTIAFASVVSATAVGVGWVTMTVRDVMKFWL